MKKNLEVIIVTLKKLASENDGLLMPEDVVDAARPLSSPLHSRFEWDNGKAAEAYRIWQARQLLRVCIETIPQSDNPVEVFVSLSSDRKEGGYRIQTQVLSDAQMRNQLLADAMAELALFREKYSRLKELASVFKAIRKVSKRKGH
jgi:hypothetical protein